MNKNSYICRVKAYCMVIVQPRLLFVFKILVVLVLLSVLPITHGMAGEVHEGGNDANPIAYDEVPVRVVVEGYKMFYLDAIYTHNKLLYVNIEDLFRMLNIACTVEQSRNQLNGFIENESKTYSIDYTANHLKVGNKTFGSPNGLISEMGSYYIESSLFAEAFGITLAFNYRAMTITLKSSFELPLIKQMRTEKMRSNLAKIQGKEVADTILQRNYHLFQFGTLDWLVNTTQTFKESAYNHFGFGLGTELLYGEADISLNYYNQYKFDNRQLQYIWRWVDNENKIVKQAQMGKITNQTISFINNQVIGAVIRNSPTTVRKATGYYTISEVTEPNWTVELYINNVLVDYTQADASGSYTFKVPIVYGYTTLKLKYYGPQGEERSEERTMNLPYTVMPVNEFEYGLSAGVVQDSSHNRFGRADFNYGVSRSLTVGGGLEYLSSITTSPYIPFAKATLQPFSSLTLNAEYAYGVRTRALLNYSFGKNSVLEIDYTNYVDGQKATIFNANEERKIKLSVPFRYKKINGFLKVDYSQLVYSEFVYNQGNAMVSMYFNQFSANSSLQMNWIGQKTPYMINETSLSYRMRNGFTFRPSARYNVSENSIMSCKAEIEKRISKAYILLSYEQYFTFKDHYVNLTFRYDLPFARASASVAQSKNKVMTSENAQGSLAFGGDKYTHVSNNSSVSIGGILLCPFLDLNRNGILDKGEHMVKLHTVKLSGGRAIYNEKDSIIRIPDLNAFISYTIEFSDKDLESISWRFTNKIYSILVDPNQFKRVEVPVISVGEVSGITYLNKNGGMKGIGRIILKLYDKSTHLEVAQTLSESDGYVYYLGLNPGEYIACVDSAQLSNLGFTVDPPCREFTIKTSEAGDIVSGLDFILRPEKVESPDSLNADKDVENEVMPTVILPFISNPEKLANEKEINKQDSVKITIPAPLHRIDQKVAPDKKSIDFIPGDTLYKVQLLALPKPLKDKNYFTKLIAGIPGLTIEETLGEDGLYHYSTQASSGISESRDLQRRIRKTGWKDSFVAKYAGERRTETSFRRKLDKLGKGSVRNIHADQLSNSNKNKDVPETIKEEPITERKNSLNIDLVNPYSALHQGEVTYVESDSSFNLPGDTLYKVQLLALSKPIRIDNYFALLLSKIPGLKIREIQGEDGIYRYSTETFRSLEKARKFNEVIRQSGWVDSFITTYFVIEKRN